MTDTELAVDLHRVIKIYKRGETEVIALRGITLEIEAGERAAIVGPSGSGKSTLMNVIGGVTVPTAGRVIVAGEDLSRLSERGLRAFRRNKVGFMWQHANLLPDLSIFDCLRLTMHAAGKFRGREVNKRANMLLEDMGLIKRKKHRIHQLSGGELQRAALTLSLANDPEIILADEPTGELDEETGKKVMSYLHQVNEEEGKTLIVVTHSLDVAAQFKRQLTITDGKLSERKIGIEELLDVDVDGRIILPSHLLGSDSPNKIAYRVTEEGIQLLLHTGDD